MGYNSNQYGSFMSGFMQGYGFIDDQRARKRAEARLEKRLTEEREHRAWQKNRITGLDEQDQIDRNRRRGFEDDIAERERRISEARRVISGLDPEDYEGGIAALEPYADLQIAKDHIQRAREAQSSISDAQRVYRESQRQGIAQGAAGIAAPDAAGPGGIAGPGAVGPQTGVAQPDQRYGSPTGYPDAGLPPAPPDVEAERRYSKAELEDIAISDPAAAARIRDEQAAMDQLPASDDAADPMGGGAITGQPYVTPRSQAVKRGKQSREMSQDVWASNLDITNPSGDPFRALPPSAKVGAYYTDRSSLTPAQQAEGDRLMAPHLETTIAENKEILANPALNPNSMEARNAKRKINEAYALKNARDKYSPLAANDVNSKGLPVNGRNQPLVDQVIQRSLEQPGKQAPASASQSKAEHMIVSRGPRNGRVSDKFVASAWRMKQRGEITEAEYRSLVSTGRFPDGSTTSLEQFDLSKGHVYQIRKAADGTVTGMEVLIESDQVDGTKQGDRLRNLLEDQGEEFLKEKAEDLAEMTGTGKNGSDYLQDFYSILAQNEAVARARGYDYGNQLDVAAIFDRYEKLHIINTAVENELYFRGQYDPSFEDAFGMTLIEALFTDISDDDLSELERPGSTLGPIGGGIFGAPVEGPGGLKPLDPGMVEAMQQQYPGITEQQIVQILNQGR